MACPERAQARISASRTFAYIASMAATQIAAVCGDSRASAHRHNPAALVSPAIPDPKPARELAALMWSCERLRRRMVAMRFGRMLDSYSRVDRQVTGPRHVACVPADRGRSSNA